MARFHSIDFTEIIKKERLGERRGPKGPERSIPAPNRLPTTELLQENDEKSPRSFPTDKFPETLSRKGKSS